MLKSGNHFEIITLGKILMQQSIFVTIQASFVNFIVKTAAKWQDYSG